MQKVCRGVIKLAALKKVIKDPGISEDILFVFTKFIFATYISADEVSEAKMVKVYDIFGNC